MAQLSQLLSRLPELKDVHMSTMGHVLWLCWHKALPPAVNQVLLNYGGMQVAEDHEQSIWFFFTGDVFLAIARLVVWGNFNELPLSVELFPGRLEISGGGEVNFSLDGSLRSQEMMVLDDIEVWIHPKSREGKGLLPGIEFESHKGRQGMAQVDWAHPIVDVRMPYASTQAWYAILHPLGSPLDKAYQEGWYAMLKRVDELLQQHKIKSIVDQSYVMIAIDNLLMLRTFMRDYMRLTRKEGGEGENEGEQAQGNGSIWPCVCVVADRNNLNFNVDLPKKINLQWDKLMPDFPYISYRNAYLLGSGFSVRDLRFTGEQTSVDTWCNVILNDEANGVQTIPLMMAGQLTTTDDSTGGCFYCGIASHKAIDCPTRTYLPSHSEIWEDVAELDLDTINKNFQHIEKVLEDQGVAGYEGLLEGDGEASVVMRAVLDISALCQLRNIPRYWLYRMREPQEGDEVPKRDDSPAWDLLEQFIRLDKEDLPDFERKLAKIVNQNQRDSRLHMLQGFVCVEKNDLERAIPHFTEAASLTPNPSIQAWNEFLLAHVEEELGHYPKAIEQFTQIWRMMPSWTEALYRSIVCRVKMGFAEQVLDQIAQLILKQPSYFNRILLDPGLERGRLLILSSLHDIWDNAHKRAAAEHPAINAMEKRMSEWFDEDHPVSLRLGPKLRHLEKLSVVHNYIAFLRVVELRPGVEQEVDDAINHEIEELRNRYKYYLDVLQNIRDEASWFPFPTALKDFSKEFNESASIINWAFACNFNEADSFKQAQNSIPRLNTLLRRLKRRLKGLRMVRDGTLFSMLLGKTFLLVETIGLLFSFVAVPIIVFWGDKIGLGWLRNMLGGNQMAILKVLVIIVTVISLGIGALRTTLLFDSRREKLLQRSREEREKAQQERLERVRAQRKAEVEQAKRQQKEEEEILQKKKMEARK